MFIKLLEQFTEEYQDVQSRTDVASDLNAKALELSEDATQLKDTVPLSLVDDVSEIILHESVPDEVMLDVSIEGDNKEEQREDYSQFTAGK